MSELWSYNLGDSAEGLLELPNALGLNIPHNEFVSCPSEPPIPPSIFDDPLIRLGINPRQILERVVTRPDPVLSLAPLDLTCSFLIVDVHPMQYAQLISGIVWEDMPIVYVSPGFEALTEYSRHEVWGRNPRFLQAPYGTPVVQNTKRQFTDHNAVAHLYDRLHTPRPSSDPVQGLGLECQTSLLNYTKTGRSFINLLSIIPITWATPEVRFYVGFQTDLISLDLNGIEHFPFISDPMPVDSDSWQLTTINKNSGIENAENFTPESIGTSLKSPSTADSFSARNRQSSQSVWSMEEDFMNSFSPAMPVEPHSSLDLPFSDSLESTYSQLLLDHCDDMVYVLSTKGSFLYVSPSVSQILQYEPEELIGQSLRTICHSFDWVTVLRELKKVGSLSAQDTQDAFMNILCRLKQKMGGYIWLESSGKICEDEQSSRKFITFTGRRQPIYGLSWKDLEISGGIGKDEFWSVLRDGIFLHVGGAVDAVLPGRSCTFLIGQSLSDIDEGGTLQTTVAAMALLPEKERKVQRVRHRMRALKEGMFIDVVTYVHPCITLEGLIETPLRVFTQTNNLQSENDKWSIKSMDVSKRNKASNINLGTPYHLPTRENPSMKKSDSTYESRSNGCVSQEQKNGQLTVPIIKNLSYADDGPRRDLIFDELSTTRGTCWQYELHQLRLVNTRLLAEKDTLENALKNRTNYPGAKNISQVHQLSGTRARGGGMKPGKRGQRSCANCGKTGSPEWRSGPTGPKTLCNACGLRWSKNSKESVMIKKEKAERAERAESILARRKSSTGK